MSSASGVHHMVRQREQRLARQEAARYARRCVRCDKAYDARVSREPFFCDEPECRERWSVERAEKAAEDMAARAKSYGVELDVAAFLGVTTAAERAV